MGQNNQVSQQMEGVGNREVVSEHEVYDITVNTHVSLLHAGNLKPSRQSMTDIMVLQK